MKFVYDRDFKTIDFRKHPHLYQIGKGEQGVLLVEPYKSEILPHWRFKTEEIAKASSEKIYQLFLEYKKNNDFIGMDMARKFLQMGYTRARRYANHASGKKYTTNPQKVVDPGERSTIKKNILPQTADWNTNEKAKAARVFYAKYVQAKKDPVYIEFKQKHSEMEKLKV